MKRGPERAFLRADDEIRTRDPFGNRMANVSCVSTVSAVPLSCTFLAFETHPSHHIAGVDSNFVGVSIGGIPSAFAVDTRSPWLRAPGHGRPDLQRGPSICLHLSRVVFPGGKREPWPIGPETPIHFRSGPRPAEIEGASGPVTPSGAASAGDREPFSSVTAEASGGAEPWETGRARTGRRPRSATRAPRPHGIARPGRESSRDNRRCRSSDRSPPFARCRRRDAAGS
jgi:hypothetical protein